MFAALFASVPLQAQDTPLATSDLADPAPTHGHSLKGDIFNEGPRQRAYLMKGTGNVHFPITTHNRMAQRFFDQGLGQLHGFWYFEAERSFREVSELDPECAVAYWGMAMANIDNEERARGFLADAKTIESKASPREAAYIDAFEAYLKPGQDDKARKLAYAKALEKIAHDYDDIEAKAFQCLMLWDVQNLGGSEVKDVQIDALMNEVLARNPMHPIHHYRIHLWNYRKDTNALNSAAACGPAAPGIAHMWHMPGHTYSELKRYADAAWQQEASARVDHAYMIRDRVLPDQIHNYAHNNQWLIEDLGYIGRVRDAVELAKNMIELPRHPVYNNDSKGSWQWGRSRLFQVLLDYELWDDLIALSNTFYLEPTSLPAQQIKRLHALGIASFSKGDPTAGNARIADLEAMLNRTGDLKLSESDARAARTDMGELHAYSALAAGRTEEARKGFDAVEGLSKSRHALLCLQLGDNAKAESLARDAVKEGKNQVVPQAVLVETLDRCGKRTEALQEMKSLQAMSGSVDMNAPIFHRISNIATNLGLSASWRVTPPPAADLGPRPPLDSLGPFRWHPSPAPDWTLRDAAGHSVSLASYRRHGRAVLLTFYLGARCSSCMEQLNAFAAAAKQFDSAGISLVAIGPETAPGLTAASAKSTGGLGFPFPLLSGSGFKPFKAYRAYDDFEHMPLHATFLIDTSGLVRWQDISYKPFTDTRFLLAESRRLLGEPPIDDTVAMK
jgi:peroxiredoxin